MRRLLLALTLTLGLLLPATSVQAATYSGNSRVSAQLSPVRKCVDQLTVYEVALRNGTRRDRWFRAFAVQRRVKVSDERHMVARRTATGLMFYVPSGQRMAITVTHRGEVILHRRLVGICY